MGYRFNTGNARHFFCAVSGIDIHHQRRSNPQQYEVHVARLDSVSPFDFRDVPVLDGVNHPHDAGAAALPSGTLRFEPADPAD